MCPAENDDWNDLTLAIDYDHNDRLNYLANVTYNKKNNPYVNNEYVDNSDEKN